MMTNPPMMAPTKMISKGSRLWLRVLSWLLSWAPRISARLLSISGSEPLSAPMRSNCNVSTSHKAPVGSAFLSDSPSGQPRVRCLKTSALKSWLSQWLEDCAVMRNASGSGNPEDNKCPRVLHQCVSMASLNKFPNTARICTKVSCGPASMRISVALEWSALTVISCQVRMIRESSGCVLNLYRR